ncbi:MAG: alpha-2-macroglobulin family protein, partial [Verrucomicrobiota bacterium]
EGQIPSRPITGETTVWVATEKTTELGYRPGGIQIVVDKDTFKSGEDAPVMLSAPGNDRYVLFTVTAENILHYQLVHMEGSARLIQLSIGENFIPNVFLQAASIYDQELLVDRKEVVVPPVKQFLDLDIIADQQQFQPGESGHFTLKVHDHEGKPVAAEVALATFDESLLYIQEDLTQDPRQFFYGQKRTPMLLTSSSFNEKSYQKVTRRDIEAEANDLLQEGIAGQLLYAPEAKQERMYYSRGMGLADKATLARRMSSAIPALTKSVSNMEVAQAAGLVLANAPAARTPAEQAVQVRSDFRTSIFWQPDIKTDASGMAKIEIKYPDSLTGWQSVAQAVTRKNQFGIGRAKTRTQQPLIARLQAPRFFVVGDTVTISAVINNNTDEAMTVAPTLEVTGVDQPQNSNRDPINIPAHSEKRVDWSVQPRAPGEARLKVTVRGGKFSDAMEKGYPIFEHGIEKFVSISGKSTKGDIHVALDLPAERKPDSTRMFVQVTPSIAVTMLDALPYLINYPYGCTEQTMSRFLPTVITARTHKQLQLDPEQVLNRVFGGIESTNAAATHPGGKQDLEKLNDMVKSSLERLYNFQHADGGWGWWKEGESDRFMTAYVLWGLSLATQSAVPIDNRVVRRAAKYLDQNIVKAEADYPMQAWMLHALAVHARVSSQPRLSDPEEKAFANLWNNRDRLNSYSRALLALAAQNFGKRDEAKTLVRNLSNGVKIDKNPGATVLNPKTGKTAPATAHWGEDGFYWRWSEGGVEATAFALRALLEIDPDNELVDPVVNWLVKNRRGAQWSNTRDTAIVVLALNDYLKISRELTHDLEYEIVVNGKSIATKKISRSELLQAPSRFEVTDFKDGKNEIIISRINGDGPIYYAANTTFFSTEEPITPAGNEIFVKRDYYKLVPIPTLLNGYTYKKQLMAPHDKVQSGDRIETVITVEAKNNYEYLIFEDLKPAGFEAVQVQSGENLLARQLRSSAFRKKPAKPLIGETNNPDERTTGNERPIYQEFRDRKVALFIDKLPEGIWEIRYEMRAEIPGEFHALPVMGHAMYVPEIRANGAESYIEIRD